MKSASPLPHGEPRKETVSQGGGVYVSFSGGDERSEPENAIFHFPGANPPVPGESNHSAGSKGKL